MKTAPAVLAGALLIVSICSCGMDRTMSSFDQVIARQNIQTDHHQLQQKDNTWVTAKNAPQKQNAVEPSTQTQQAALRSDPESAFVMRDDQNRIRTIGKPALTTSVPSLIPDPNENDSEDRHNFMK